MTDGAPVYQAGPAQLSTICLPTGFGREAVRSQSVRNGAGFIGEKKWCRGAESNCRHHDFQSCALPTELPRHLCVQLTLLQRVRVTVAGRRSL